MIGVISVAHGLIRPKVFEILKGDDLIIHAKALGGVDVLNGLETIALVMTVRGNDDGDLWADHIPQKQVVKHGSHIFYLLHDLEHLDFDPEAAKFLG